MAFIIWNDDLKVNVRQIDDQHRELVRLVNQLADAMKSGHGKDALESLFRSLVDYTILHFTMEEGLMRRHTYPDSANHRIEHEGLKQSIADLRQRATSGGLTVTLDTMNFLKNWLQHHILETDKKFGAYLNSKDVS